MLITFDSVSPNSLAAPVFDDGFGILSKIQGPYMRRYSDLRLKTVAITSARSSTKSDFLAMHIVDNQILCPFHDFLSGKLAGGLDL